MTDKSKINLKKNCVRRVDWIPKNVYLLTWTVCSQWLNLRLTDPIGRCHSGALQTFNLFSDWKNATPHHNTTDTDKPEDQFVKTVSADRSPVS